MATTDNIRLDFICLQNAGRSQMAGAFAERERDERNLEDIVEIHTGGTDPADSIHEEVVQAMADIGINIAERTPKYVSDLGQLKQTNYLVTMGCTISKFNPAQYGVESREWDLTNPDGEDMETVRDVRNEIERRVEVLFDDLEPLIEEKRSKADASGGLTAAIRDVLSF